MRTAILVLTGVTVAVTGAFIRGCAASASTLDAALARSWCGHAPALTGHCPGCAMIFLGTFLAAAALLVRGMPHRLSGVRT